MIVRCTVYACPKGHEQPHSGPCTRCGLSTDPAREAEGTVEQKAGGLWVATVEGSHAQADTAARAVDLAFAARCATVRPRRKLPPEERLSATVRARVTEADREALVAAAGGPRELSAWIRATLLAAL